MLNKHLIAKTNPIANPNNVIFYKDYRITILKNSLFRIEKSSSNMFRDRPTQSIWFRNTKNVNYTTEIISDELYIRTSRCTLIVSNKREDCRILLNNKEILIDNNNNLLGTYRTLDRCDGNIQYDDPFLYQDRYKELQLETGVCSKNGVAFIDDSNSLSIDENGMIIDEKANGIDHYVFAYGKDYKGAVKALFEICGPVPLIPKFALGNWWSRFHPYTEKEYLGLLNKFEDQNVPFTVATIDMDWHYYIGLDEKFEITKKGRNTPFYGGNFGWTGYSWNKELFPDYKRFLKKIKEKNMAITLNLHPADGVRWFEDCYKDFALSQGIDPSTCEQVKFNMTSSNFINNYFDIIHRPYESDGVDFWWIDWQQGTKSQLAGLDPLWSLNHYHFLDSTENHDIPLILSRYCGVGSHRYPLGFSADTFITWKTIDYIPYFTATASNIGYTWWSHDIGGHMLGAKDDELYCRFIQLGVFLPINRLHNTRDDTMSKEPWEYHFGVNEISKEFLRLRHQLIPFIYSQSYKTHKFGLPLIEPLYYYYKTSKAYQYKNEYFFGENLLVIPITKKMGQDKFSKVEAYIPKGTWTDFFTNQTYHFNKETVKTLYRSIESIPVLVKEGSFIVLSKDSGNSLENPQNLEVLSYFGNGKYDLYEDKNKQLCVTSFKSEVIEKNQIITIETKGDKMVIPNERVITLKFKNITKGNVLVYENDCLLEDTDYYFDTLAVRFKYNAFSKYQIVITDDSLKGIDKLKDDLIKKLLKLEEDNNFKGHLSRMIRKSSNKEEILEVIRSSSLNRIKKNILLEVTNG